MPRRNSRNEPDDRRGSLDRLKDEMGLRGTGRKPMRGEIWFTDFGRRGQHVQEGIRPAVIISANAGIARVVPITSNTGHGWMREHVIIEEQDIEDLQPLEPFSTGVALAEQVTTVADDAFRSYVGRVSWESRKMLDLGQALKGILCIR